MEIDTKLISVTDPPLIPFEGIINTLNSVTRRIYYRPLTVTSALTLTTKNNQIILGLAQGAGTVSSINDLVGDITFANGIDTSVSISSNIAINVLSANLATANTIPKRDANGIFSVGTPIIPSHVANKEYVDSVAQSLRPQIPADVLKTASFGNLAAASGVGVDVVFTGTGVGKTLRNDGANSTSGYVVLNVDGDVMTVGARILVIGNGLHNGIYEVTTIGDAININWVITRVIDFDDTPEVLSGSYVYIKSGTVNATSGWVLTTVNPITVDVTSQTWLQFNSAGQVIGNNIGTGGVGLYKQKAGQSLQFYNINGGSSKITVALDPSNNEVDIDVNEADFNLNNLAGPLFPLRGGTGLSAYATGNFLVSNGLSPFTNDKVVPAGVVIGTTDIQTMTNKTLIGGTNTISSSHLRSSTTDIAINTNTPPGAGYSLITTSTNNATWQLPFTVSGITTTSQTYYGFGGSSTLNSYSVAIGTSAAGSGTYSIALGHNTIASANYSIAIGGNSSSTHNNSIMIGTGTTDTEGQMKLTNNITTIKSPGLQNVGTGQVVCRTSTGLVGPNTNGAMILPINTTDPSAVSGGAYYNSSTNKLKTSNGTNWVELATTSKETLGGLIAGTTVLKTFADTISAGANWRYVLTSPGNGYRAGDIIATWEPATTSIAFTERSTADIGDTSAVTLSVTHIAGAITWEAVITGLNTWSVVFYEELY